jgi:hypothetical protein
MNNTRRCQRTPSWSTQDIDSARNTSLAPILAQRGYATTRLPNGAVLLRNFQGLLIHGNRWSWRSERLHGNTLDFFITLEGKTFAQAMQIVCDSSEDDPTNDDL